MSCFSWNRSYTDKLQIKACFYQNPLITILLIVHTVLKNAVPRKLHSKFLLTYLPRYAHDLPEAVATKVLQILTWNIGKTFSEMPTIDWNDFQKLDFLTP